MCIEDQGTEICDGCGEMFFECNCCYDEYTDDELLSGIEGLL